MRSTIVLSIILSVLATNGAHPAGAASQGTHAQLSVRQGDALPTEFRSPMVLDLALDPLRDVPDGKPWIVEDLKKYYCDDVSLDRLRITRSLKKNGRFVVLTTQVRTYTRDTDDRLASVVFELVRGDEVISTWELKEISAEAGEHNNESCDSPLLAEAEFRSLFASEPAPHLRITVQVQRD